MILRKRGSPATRIGGFFLKLLLVLTFAWMNRIEKSLYSPFGLIETGGPIRMEQNRGRLIFLATSFLLLAVPLQAQEADAKKKPLLWGADPDGGIPYVFQDPSDPEKTIGFEMDLARALEHV